MNNDIEIVSGIYDAYRRRDMEAIHAALDPDVVIEQNTPLPWGGYFSGPTAVTEFFGKLLGHIESHIEIEELISTGGNVVQIGHSSGKVLSTGKEFRVRELHVWELRDGKVVSFRPYAEYPPMLAALESA